MLAVAADLVRAERSLASVALAVHAHHDTLLDPFCLSAAGRGRRWLIPLPWIDLEVILGEQGTGFILPNLHVRGCAVHRALGQGLRAGLCG